MGGPGASGPVAKEALSLDPSSLQTLVQQRLDRLRVNPEAGVLVATVLQTAVHRVLEEATRIAETSGPEDADGESDALASTLSKSGGKLGSTLSSTTRGNAANVRPRIVPRHCQVAIRSNEELFRLFQGGSGDMDVILDKYFMDGSTKAALTRTGLLVDSSSPKDADESQELVDPPVSSTKGDSRKTQGPEGSSGKSRLVTKEKAREMDRQREQAKAEWKKRPDDVVTEAELAHILGKVNPLYRLSHDAGLLLIALVREKAKVIAATLAEHSLALEAQDELSAEMVWSAVQHDFPAETVRSATALLRRTHPSLATHVSHTAPTGNGGKSGPHQVEVLGVRVRLMREGELLWGAKEKRLSVPSIMPCAKFYESALFRIGNADEAVVFVHEGSKMPAGDSTAAERVTVEEAGLHDGSTVFVFNKMWWEHKQRDDARRGMLTTQRSNKQEVQAIKSAARSKVHAPAPPPQADAQAPATEAAPGKPSGEKEQQEPARVLSPRPKRSDHASEAKHDQPHPKPLQPALARLKARAAARAAKAEATAAPAAPPEPGEARPPFDASPPSAEEERRSPRVRRGATGRDEHEKEPDSPPKPKLLAPRRRVVEVVVASKAEGTPRPPSPTAQQPAPEAGPAAPTHVPRPPAPSTSAEVEEEWRRKRKMLLMKRTRAGANAAAPTAASAAMQKKQPLHLPRKPQSAVTSGAPAVGRRLVTVPAQRARQQQQLKLPKSESATPALVSPSRRAGASQAADPSGGSLRAEDEVALKWLMLKVALADIQSRVRSYKPTAPPPTAAARAGGGSRPTPSSGPSAIATGIFRTFVEDVRVLDSTVKALQAWVLSAGLQHLQQPSTAPSGPSPVVKLVPKPSSALAPTTAASRVTRKAGPTPTAPSNAPPTRRPPQVGARQLVVAKPSAAPPSAHKPTAEAPPTLASPSRPVAPSRRGPDAATEESDEPRSARPTFSDRVAAARAARRAAAAAGSNGQAEAPPAQHHRVVTKAPVPRRPQQQQAPTSPKIDPLAVTAPDPFRANSPTSPVVHLPEAHQEEAEPTTRGPGPVPSAYADDDFVHEEDDEEDSSRKQAHKADQPVPARSEALAPVQQHEPPRHEEQEQHYYEEAEEEEAVAVKPVEPVELQPRDEVEAGGRQEEEEEEPRWEEEKEEAKLARASDEQHARPATEVEQAADVRGEEDTQPSQAVNEAEEDVAAEAPGRPSSTIEAGQAGPTNHLDAAPQQQEDDVQTHQDGAQPAVQEKADGDARERTENEEQVIAA